MSAKTLPETYFAPAGRATSDELARVVAAANQDPFVRVVLDALGAMVLVLNEQRQIVAASREIYSAVGCPEAEAIGLRPGELLGCINARKGPDGCGTAAECRQCGAVVAILQSQLESATADGECRLTLRRTNRLVAGEYRIHTSPVQIGDDELTVVVLTDISDQKRREVLERVFLHDLKNLLTGMIGWSRMLASQTPGTAADKVESLARRIAETVDSHRQLLQAEAGDLELREQTFTVAELLADVADTYRSHPVAEGKALSIEPGAGGESLRTDRGLLLRVVTNLVTNALEASAAGGAVRVWCEPDDAGLTFCVHNAGEVPEDVALTIFQRSFSTKGRGRGLGTYSVRLLGETYLGGRVGFTTSAADGTAFRFTLPRPAR